MLKTVKSRVVVSVILYPAILGLVITETVEGLLHEIGQRLPHASSENEKKSFGHSISDPI
jgi:hypothetical protein